MKKMMEDIIIIEKGSDTMEERISLAAERIREFPEPLKDRQLCSYFSCLRDFILKAGWIPRLLRQVPVQRDSFLLSGMRSV